MRQDAKAPNGYAAGAIALPNPANQQLAGVSACEAI
jgi:hypothetical protein